MKKIRKPDRKKRNDFLLLLLILIVALAAGFFLVVKGTQPGMTAVVTVDGKEVGRYSLLQEKEIAIGDTNVLVIKDGAADMILADCPDQVCVKHPAISKTGESIICLPNKVVVTIVTINGDGKDGTLDVIVK